MSTSPFLKILSFGAGAIGTYLGGSLALHGHQVVFLERPSIVADIRQNGLRLSFADREAKISDPLIVSSLEDGLALGPFDAALFAMKSYDTAAAVNSLIPFQDNLPPILCLQNGVDNEGLIAAVLGPERVIPASVTSAIGRRTAGDIILERLRGIAISDGYPISSRLTEAMSESGLNASLFPNSRDMKWSKMLTNLVGNATSAILDLTPAEVFSHPGLFKIEIQQLRETLTVMKAQNIHVVNLPGTPVRLLAIAARYLPLKLSQVCLIQAIGGGRGGKMPSFHIDLHNGRGLSEVGYLNGAVVKYAGLTNCQAPVNRFLTETLIGLTTGELPLELFKSKPQKFIDAYKKNISGLA
jgi:2-dehydropantoate 2-reductase